MPDGGVDLLCQLARRRNDEGADTAARSAYQPLQDRQHEDRCLARAGLGKAHDVLSLEDRRDRLFLDRCWRYKASCLYPGSDVGVKIKRLKFHKTPFFCVRGKKPGCMVEYNDVVFIRVLQLF